MTLVCICFSMCVVLIIASLLCVGLGFDLSIFFVLREPTMSYFYPPPLQCFRLFVCCFIISLNTRLVFFLSCVSTALCSLRVIAAAASVFVCCFSLLPSIPVSFTHEIGFTYTGDSLYSGVVAPSFRSLCNFCPSCLELEYT